MTAPVQQLTVLTGADIKPGQILRIHEKIQDVNAKGDVKERTQIFEGLVLGIRGSGPSKSFTIRKETEGFGVEKIFPVSSPNIGKIELVKTYAVRRAKLSYTKNFERKMKEVATVKAS